MNYGNIAPIKIAGILVIGLGIIVLWTWYSFFWQNIIPHYDSYMSWWHVELGITYLPLYNYGVMCIGIIEILFWIFLLLFGDSVFNYFLKNK